MIFGDAKRAEQLMQLHGLSEDPLIAEDPLEKGDAALIRQHFIRWYRDRPNIVSIDDAFQMYCRRVNARATTRNDLHDNWSAHIAAIRATNLNDYNKRTFSYDGTHAEWL